MLQWPMECSIHNYIKEQKILFNICGFFLFKLIYCMVAHFPPTFPKCKFISRLFPLLPTLKFITRWSFVCKIRFLLLYALCTNMSLSNFWHWVSFLPACHQFMRGYYWFSRTIRKMSAWKTYFKYKWKLFTVYVFCFTKTKTFTRTYKW